MDTSRLSDMAETIVFQVGAWEDFGYADPPGPDCKPIPPLGDRSANAIRAGHAAVDDIDKLIRQLHDIRSDLVCELRKDSEIRAERIDAFLSRPAELAEVAPQSTPTRADGYSYILPEDYLRGSAQF